ncbi:hypothetical protein HDU76_000167 [Blyttiomyces sp. JEL0837]|nr:hypothetical protein HDU76_000167 [Blyttiomyces sp. JEL0837]
MPINKTTKPNSPDKVELVPTAFLTASGGKSSTPAPAYNQTDESLPAYIDPSKPAEEVDPGYVPEISTNIFSVLTYEWMTSIFIKGWKRPLEQTDMWKLPPNYGTKFLSDRLSAKWEENVKNRPPPPPQQPEETAPIDDNNGNNKRTQKAPKSTEGLLLRKTLLDVYFGQVAPLGFIKFMADLCSTFSPLLVKYIIQFVIERDFGKDRPLSTGFGLIVGLFLLQIMGSILLNSFFQNATKAGLSMRTSLSAMIYRKTLKLSSAARQEFDSGRLITLVATDSNRIETFMTFIHIIWTAPIQVFIIVAFLYAQIGWASLIGVSLLFILTPVQGLLFKKLMLIRKTVAPLTDQRVKLTTEVLNGIRVIKFFAWEVPFLSKIEDIRRKEVAQVLKRSILTAFVMTIAFGVPVISAAIAFVIYGLTKPLDPAAIFSALTWFGQLKMPLMFLPQVISGWADFKIALSRIEALLLAPELDTQPAIDHNLPYAVKITDATFEWEALPKKPTDSKVDKDGKPIGPPGAGSKPNDMKEKQISDTTLPTDDVEPIPAPKSTLRNINLTIERGSLVAVVGTVGSGKSSLLHAIIGEMKRTTGTVTFSGTMGYAPQSAWIQNANLRDNVLFGRPYDCEQYLKALRDCALEQDLKVLPDGDLTSIGERGINLSGGQKQRVNLARCVYFEADIVLLDDPLSAVDAHVGKYLFDNCIMGALKEKTRILVTHQLHFLHRVDYVVVMRDGEIVEQGPYQTLLDSHGEFARLISNYGAEDTETKPKDVDDPTNTKTHEKKADEKKHLENFGDQIASKKPSKNIMTVEERATGKVNASVWWSYLLSAGGYIFITGLLLVLSIVQATRLGNDLWLVWWSDNKFDHLTSFQYVIVYCAWGFAQALATFMFGVFFAYAGTRAARVLHAMAAARVLRAPVAFFDTTPLGRIINRFSKDQDGIDNTLVDAFRMFVHTLSTVISTFILVIYATPIFAAPLIPILVMYYFIQLIYRASSRELKRLDSVSRSPLYANFGETLTGLPTIRAYRESGSFILNNDKATDANNSPYYLLFTAQRWLGFRLETLGAFLVFFAATFGIVAGKGNLSPSLLGLSLSYALQVTNILNWCVRQFTDTEIAMNAVERVDHLAHKISIEAEPILAHSRPPPGWPKTGNITFTNVSMRYSKDLPLVLKNVTFQINNKQKIGIVGRTGSGKSSLMQVLFRMFEPSSGYLTIDGIDTQSIGLKDLRSGLAIIPQDPVLFSGSFRTNLDPFGEYTDNDLWDALSRSGLKSKVAESGGGLDSKVTDGGENLSVGQRQLLCLSRAMLKKPRILIMDEATANVDFETDALIQKAIRDDFRDATVLTIAHRLNTIIDYDRVLVMEEGRVVEFDKPGVLLGDEGSRFKGMVDETGVANAEMLKALAVEALAVSQNKAVGVGSSTVRNQEVVVLEEKNIN